jgi:hypothetical protein
MIVRSSLPRGVRRIAVMDNDEYILAQLFMEEVNTAVIRRHQ